MAGSIDLLPPSSAVGALPARGDALGPATGPAGLGGRHTEHGPAGPAARAPVVIIDVTPEAAGGEPADSGWERHHRRGAFHHARGEDRRSPFSTVPPDGTDPVALRRAREQAYRTADGLAPAYTSRGTFYDFSI